MLSLEVEESIMSLRRALLDFGALVRYFARVTKTFLTSNESWTHLLLTTKKVLHMTHFEFDGSFTTSSF